MEVWLARVLGIICAALSVFGFLNAFVLLRHGPGFDLGVVAGFISAGAFYAAHYMRENP